MFGDTLYPSLSYLGAQIGNHRVGYLDNGSVVPRDRVFFLYNFYDSALKEPHGTPSNPGVATSTSIERYVIGAEKTFYDGWLSLEIRVPFTRAYDYGLFVAPNSQGIGNIPLIFKMLLARNPNWSVGAGVAVYIPSAADITIYRDFVSSDLIVKSRAAYVSPYVGLQWTPGERFFYQGFLQFDFATSGNPVFDTDSGFNDLARDQNLLMLRNSVGYWLYRNNNATWLTGVAGLAELHYMTTITDRDINIIQEFTNPAHNLTIVNATLGLHLQMTEMSSLRFSVVAPLSTDSNRLFDSEYAMQMQRRF